MWSGKKRYQVGGRGLQCQWTLTSGLSSGKAQILWGKCVWYDFMPSDWGRIKQARLDEQHWHDDDWYFSALDYHRMQHREREKERERKKEREKMFELVQEKNKAGRMPVLSRSVHCSRDIQLLVIYKYYFRYTNKRDTCSNRLRINQNILFTEFIHSRTGWLAFCRFSGSLRQYFSLLQVVLRRQGNRMEIW